MSDSMSDPNTSPTPPSMPESFEEFWPYYVSQHQNKTCRQLHFVGTSIALGCVAAAPFYPPALLAAPVAGYGMAWIGHFVFEKNKPASWGGAKAFAYSLRGDLRMWKMMATRKMDAEVERVMSAYAANGAASTTTTASNGTSAAPVHA